MAAGVAEAEGAGDCPVVAPGEGGLFAAIWSWGEDDAAATGAVEMLLAAIWSWTGAAEAADGDGAVGFAGGFGAGTGLLWVAGCCEDDLPD